MLWALAFIGAGVVASDSGFEEVELRGRPPLGVLIHTPSKEAGPIPTSYLLGVLRAEIEARTDWLPREIPPEQWESCGGSLPCVFSNPSLFEGDMRHVLWISNLTSAATSRLSIQLIDVPAAVRAARTTTVADLGSYLASTAVLVGSERQTLRAAAELGPVIERFVALLRPVAEPAGVWGRSSTLLLELDAVPMQLRVDEGRYELTIREPQTRLLSVPLGVRHLELSSDEHETIRADVEITADREATLHLSPVLADTPGGAARTIGLWSGVGAVLTGGGLVAAGVALSQRSSICLVGPDQHCSPLGRGRGPVLAGAGVAAGGLGLLFGALLVGREQDWPWVGIVGGVVLGVATGSTLALVF